MYPKYRYFAGLQYKFIPDRRCWVQANRPVIPKTVLLRTQLRHTVQVSFEDFASLVNVRPYIRATGPRINRHSGHYVSGTGHLRGFRGPRSRPSKHLDPYRFQKKWLAQQPFMAPYSFDDLSESVVEPSSPVSEESSTSGYCSVSSSQDFSDTQLPSPLTHNIVVEDSTCSIKEKALESLELLEFLIKISKGLNQNDGTIFSMFEDCFSDLQKTHEIDFTFESDPEAFIVCIVDQSFLFSLLSTPDFLLLPILGVRYMKCVYSIRSFLDYCTELSTNPIFSEEGGFFSSFTGFFSNFKVDSAFSIKKMVDSVTKQVFGLFESLSGFVNSCFCKAHWFISQSLISIFEKIVGFGLDHISSKMFQYSMSIVTLMLLIGFMALCGLVTKCLFSRIINFFSKSDVIVSESFEGTKAVGASIGILGACFGAALSENDSKSLRSRMLFFTTLVATGTILASFVKWMFFILPIGLQDCLIYNYGTDCMIQEREIDVWKSQSFMLIKVHKIPVILASELFLEKLKASLDTGESLMKSITEPAIRSVFVKIYGELVSIRANLLQLKFGGATRLTPFCLHIAGVPGVGKTTVVPQLIQDLVGDVGVFSVPSGPFWSGFLNQKVIKIDEFLCGTTTEAARKAEEYLQLVSSDCFQPNLPTIDNPTMGIKGTHARPKMVITLNNTLYNQVPGINPSALHRRRNFVIVMAFHSKAYFKGRSAIDMSKYTQEQISRLEWAVFKICPSEIPGDGVDGAECSNWMCYTTLVEILRVEYKRHMEMGEKLQTALKASFEENIDPEKVMLDVLREQHALPSKPVSLFECLSKLVQTEPGKSEIMTESPRSHRHYCRDCEISFYHVECVAGRFPCCLRNFNPIVTEVKDKPLTLSDVRPLFNSSLDTLAFQEMAESNFAIEKEIVIDSPCIICKLTPVLSPGLMCRTCTAEYEKVKYCDFNDQHETNDGYQLKIPVPHRHLCYTCGMYFTHNHGLPMTHLVTNCGSDCPGQRNFSIQKSFEEINDQTLNKGNKLSWRYKLFSYYNSFKYTTKLVSVASIFVVLVTVVGAAAVMGSYFSGNKEEELTFCTEESGIKNKQRRPKAHVSRSYGLGKLIVTPRVGEIMSEGTTSNCTITVGQLSIYGFCVRDRWILTFLHAFVGLDSKGNRFLKLEDQQEVEIMVSTRTFQFKLDLKKTVCCLEKDMLLFQVSDLQFPRFKDSTKRFLTHVEYSKLISGSAILKVDGSDKVLPFHKPDEPLVYRSPTIGPLQLDQYIIYQGVTQPGWCGSLIICGDGDYAGKILGYHVGGSLRKDSDSVGVASVILLEDLNDAFKQIGVVKFRPGEDIITEGVSFGPNFEYLYEDNRQIRIPHSSKILPSKIRPYLAFNSVKSPAIMSRNDIRANGQDPVLKMFEEVGSIGHKSIDIKRLNRCKKTVLKNLIKGLNWPNGTRVLSMDEACFGVPGKLAAINFSTSPGYPLINLRNCPSSGKHEFVSYINGEKWISPLFEQLVLSKYKLLCEGRHMDHIWLGYLKDEVVSLSKIEACRTRVIFCGDLVTFVAARMRYGSLLCALNSSFETTCLAIGLNQFSFDMDVLFHSLSHMGTQFVAGDYKSFDKRVHPDVQIAAYDILKDLSFLIPGNSTEMFSSFFDTQVNSPALMDGYIFQPKAYHMSGCFFTTIVNCLVNDLYMRYCFEELNPRLEFDDFVAAKYCGDDNILCVREGCNFSPVDIRETMVLLDQIYTSDTKDQFIEVFRSFEDCTFLGAHPKKIGSMYTGALRKITLHECLLWTKDKDRSIVDRCGSMIDMCSQWDQEFFEMFATQVLNGLQQLEYSFSLKMNYLELQLQVAQRTASSGLDFIDFINPTHNLSLRRDVPLDIITESGESPTTVVGLTMLHTDQANESGQAKPMDDSRSGLSEKWLNIGFGTDSFVKRSTYTWNTQAYGEILQNVTVPFGVLNAGNTTNIQNMPFDNFTFWHGDVEIMFQVNGQPFQAGLLIAYFYPFTTSTGTGIVEKPAITLATCCDHVFIQPNVSNTAVLRIPYRFPRNVLNTFTRGTPRQETFGQVQVRVLSPLTTSTACTVTTYSRFPNSVFTIPRPVIPTTVCTEGQTFSTSSSSTYNVGDVIGNVPMENGVTTGTTQEISPNFVMDNPPCVGGSIPTYKQFSSLSKTNGVEPTVGLSLHPKNMYRKHHAYFDPKEMSMDYLCGKKSLLTKFTWDISDASDAPLLLIDLNSDLTTEPATATPSFLTVMLGQCVFFRCDFVFEFQAVRTRFHSGRLRATVAYAAPSLAAADQSTYYNHVMDFRDQADHQCVSVNWNSPTEYLRTYEGPGAPDPIQNYSLGKMGVFVANELVTNTEQDAIEVLVFVRAVNVSLAVPRPVPFYYLDNISRTSLCKVTQYIPATESEKPVEVDKTSVSDIVTEGPSAVGDSDSDIALTQPVENSNLACPDVIGTTEAKSVSAETPCTLHPGAKFEYPVASVLDFIRRGVKIDAGNVFIKEDLYVDDEAEGTFVARGYRHPVVPFDRYRSLYSAWAGSMRYRIYTGSNNFTEVFYNPSMIDGSTMALDGFLLHPSVRDRIAGDDGMTIKIQSEGSSGTYQAREVLYPVNDRRAFIDVMVPFQSHFGFLCYEPTYNKFVTPVANGNLTIMIQGQSRSVNVFVMVGDDFAYGIFRPPRTIGRAFPAVTVNMTPGTYVFGGFWLVQPKPPGL